MKSCKQTAITITALHIRILYSCLNNPFNPSDVYQKLPIHKQHKSYSFCINIFYHKLTHNMTQYAKYQI